ncbi:MAG: hypothetical protein JXB17_13470 [Bacteroidales bacterium]|nr:hypothetical protein [Bacteroidales bacterium]
MMDKLEKFIIENRDDFNIYEPSQEVWNKIKKSTKQTKVKKLNWGTIVWRAAVIILLFGTTFFLYQISQTPKEEVSKVAIKQIMKKIPELAEADAYYTALTNSKLKEIRSQLSDDPELQKDILKDVSELDSMHEDLMKDLFDNVETQEIVEAMVQNYRLKLEILEEILDELKNSEKTYEHENEQVQYEL